MKFPDQPSLRFGAHLRVPDIRQDEAAECGLACLAMVASAHGHDVDLLSLRRRFSTSLKGMTLRALLGFAEELDLSARAVKAAPEALPRLSTPAILHWDFSHYVVLAAVKPGRRRCLLIHDPAAGPLWLTRQELLAHYTGVAIELEPSIAFQPRRDRTKLSLWQLWSRSRGLGPALGRVFLLSVMIQLFMLAAPFFLQIGVDTVVPASDYDLLTVLALGFASLALLNLLTSALRALMLVNLGNELGLRLVSNLFRRMTQLPNEWFERRSTGEVLTRFNATQPIVDLVSHGLVSSIVDGGMAIITLVLMIVYSPVLAAVSVGALLSYVALRLAFLGLLRARTTSVVLAQAREQSVLIETIRGITALKLFGREPDRHRIWQNKRVALVNAQVGTGRLQAIFDTTNSFITALENIVFVYLAIRMVMAGHFTIGMMYAFSSYKQQFLVAGLNLVGRMSDYRLLDVQLGRIADIALEKPEDLGAPAWDGAEPIIGRLELRGVGFAYSRAEAPVLKKIDLVIEPGETVAIVGASGCGKTTLLKVALGLLQPSQGVVLVDGRPLQNVGLTHYRRHVAAVMQDDTLYAGSIAENIALFDPDIDLGRVIAAASAALIHAEVLAMPMGYESLIGDLGTALSGGQRQRVLLARALYHRPAILFMDEGTAHLDVAMERAVANSLATLSITRVIVAHRPETIKLADRVVEIADGRARVAAIPRQATDLPSRVRNAFALAERR